MNYIDELPLDVIRVYIFPYLDYESRINLMMLLKPEERQEISKYYKISAKLVQRLDMKKRATKIIEALIICQPLYGEKREEAIIKFLDVLEKNLDTCHFFPTFGQEVKKKIDVKHEEFSNSESFAKYLNERTKIILSKI
jgi:hypothetical protein